MFAVLMCAWNCPTKLVGKQNSPGMRVTEERLQGRCIHNMYFVERRKDTSKEATGGLVPTVAIVSLGGMYAPRMSDCSVGGRVPTHTASFLGPAAFEAHCEGFNVGHSIRLAVRSEHAHPQQRIQHSSVLADHAQQRACIEGDTTRSAVHRN